MNGQDQDRFAPLGYVWECAACGKRAQDRYGINGTQDIGWDVSCVINCVLVQIVAPKNLDGADK
jgi:hypothetical protein